MKKKMIIRRGSYNTQRFILRLIKLLNEMLHRVCGWLCFILFRSPGILTTETAKGIKVIWKFLKLF